MSVIPQVYNQGTGLIGSAVEGNQLPENVQNLVVDQTLTVIGTTQLNGDVQCNSDVNVDGTLTASDIVADNVTIDDLTTPLITTERLVVTDNTNDDSEVTKQAPNGELTITSNPGIWFYANNEPNPKLRIENNMIFTANQLITYRNTAFNYENGLDQTVNNSDHLITFIDQNNPNVGDRRFKTNDDLSYNPSTTQLKTPQLEVSGPTFLLGDLTIDRVFSSINRDCRILFQDTQAPPGDGRVKQTTNFKFRPSDNTLILDGGGRMECVNGSDIRLTGQTGNYGSYIVECPTSTNTNETFGGLNFAQLGSIRGFQVNNNNRVIRIRNNAATGILDSIEVGPARNYFNCIANGGHIFATGGTQYVSISDEGIETSNGATVFSESFTSTTTQFRKIKLPTTAPNIGDYLRWGGFGNGSASNPYQLIWSP